ncbi:MAG: phosphatase PAP2 family protein [Erysipelotrichaceae bacterium]|nr:phosphatase PAP2 family protein [Erysipelotrichaceae bacterium]
MVKMLKKENIRELLALLMPAAITFGFNCLVYFSTKFMISPDRFVFLDMAIDRILPFVPQFVIIYYLSFAQWANYYLQASLGPTEKRNLYFSADLLAKVICFVIFLVWPVAMRWPELPQDGSIWTKILSMTYGVDSPARAFPSLHCFYSWIAFRYSYETEPKGRRWLVWTQLIFSLTVFATTMLIRQHYFIDVIGGIAVAEVALFIADRTKLPVIFERAMERIASTIRGKDK